ncbi:MAG: hypothetical protein EOM55_04990 [Clostridia bacterium]|nr:hypothetical protein [Clostridia bacterium]
MNERKLSALQKEYRTFFLGKMELYGVKSPAELTKDKKSDFFTEIKQDWAKHKLERQQLIEANKNVLTIVKEPLEVCEKSKSINKETSPVKKWKEYFGRELSFDSFQFNNRDGSQQVIEKFEIKPYFFYRTILLKKIITKPFQVLCPINRGLVQWLQGHVKVCGLPLSFVSLTGNYLQQAHCQTINSFTKV